MLTIKPNRGRGRTAGTLAATLMGIAMTPLAVAQNVDSSNRAHHQAVPDLPLAISSFGAALEGDSLYVYGGHIGTQHVHSFENLSQLFLRYPLESAAGSSSPGWLALPPGPPLQGTALVEHDGAIYRVGGMRANNPRREPGELHSVKSAARFLPEENRWQRLMALPSGRSSHDLAVVNDLLVVAGGWELRGSASDPLWERTVFALDLTTLDDDSIGEWSVLTETPVGVRANTAVGLDGKLWVLGGIDDNGDTTRRVDIYDPATDTWASGPDLPASGSLNGFGADAVTVNGVLLVSQADGRIYSIRSGDESWNHAGDLHERRFFHRLVSDGESLLAIAGANRTGHLSSVERHALSDLQIEDGQIADESWTPAGAPSANHGTEWATFRDGGASIAEGSALPLAWDQPGWTAELPAFGHSSPVVRNGVAYVTSVAADGEDAKDTLWLTAIRVADGEELWRQSWPASERLPYNQYTARAAPTPAIDADRITLFFGTGDLFATNHDGNRLWHRNLSDDHGSFAGNHGVGGSVLLTDDHAVVLLARKTYSYLLAVDRATGEDRWKVEREPGVSWTTPTLSPDRREIVVSSNGSVEGYDAATGEKLWWIPGVKSNTTQSPLITDEVVVISGSERPANFAVRRGARGELGEDDIVWHSESTSHFASPVLAGDCIYWANAAGVAQCIDPENGKSHWQQRLSQPAWVTPIAAGDRIFFFGEKGATDVLSAGPGGGEVLAKSRVEVDEYLTGVVPAGDAFLLRTGKLLHAVRGEAAAGDSQADSEEVSTDEATFLDEVTVTAAHVPASLRETPGHVSIVTDEDIADHLYEDVADLVKYEPGVYVEGDATRLGLNGFNIRGIGGNRVLTQVDGVPTAEQFDFGPFNVHQQAIDIDTLKSAEIVRSAGSALYGSDAVGGVISLITKNPSDYLGNGNHHFGLKTGFDGRSRDRNLNLTAAGGGEAARASLFVSTGRSDELDNAGQTGGTGMDRDQPNPQERERLQALGKAAYDISTGNTLRATFELNTTDAETEVISALGTSRLGPFTITNFEVLAEDTQDRNRASLEQVITSRGTVDQWSWRINTQSVDTAQNVREHRLFAAFGPPLETNRNGNLTFEQTTFSADINGLVETGTGDSFSSAFHFGGSFLADEFDMLRDRIEHDLSGRVVPTQLVFPSKYFPQTDTEETGAYAQAELRWNRITLIPGVRYDRFIVDADPGDAVYIAAGGLPVASLDADAVSPKLGAAFELHRTTTLTAQYAAGFRAPPYSSINTGFTNLAGGYQTLANPGLDPEISDNFELGLRWSAGGTSWSIGGFRNHYDDFIEFQTAGFNRQLNVVEFQNVNLTEVEIDGVEFRLESRLGDNVLLRAAYAHIDGHDTTGEIDVPLASIAPNEGVVGLRYLADSAKWGLDGSIRIVDDRDPGKVAEGEHIPDGYQVVDVVAFFALPADMKLRVGVLNATDEAYFESWHVRGRQANDPSLLLYSSPGRNVVASLTYNW